MSPRRARCAPAGNGAVAAPGAAVVVEQGHPDQRRRLMPAQRAQLAHVGDQCTGQYQAHPLERGQAGKQCFLAGALSNDRAHLALDLFDFGAQRGVAPVGALPQRRRLQPTPLMLERDELVLSFVGILSMTTACRLVADIGIVKEMSRRYSTNTNPAER